MSDSPSTPLMRWVRKARGERTLRGFEAESGVSNALICQLENGSTKNPGINTLNAIAAASEGRCKQITLK